MTVQSWIDVIKKVAEEQGFEVSEGAKTFSIYIDKYHGVAYQLSVNSSGYVQAKQWESDGDDERWGRAVYSIRNFSDAVNFCQILMNSSLIRAKKKV